MVKLSCFILEICDITIKSGSVQGTASMPEW